jgi:hypothetical protein
MLVTIHLTIAILTGLIVLYSDEQAFMWVLGKKTMLERGRISFLHRAVTTGLTLLIITGGLLYADAAPAYLSVTLFTTKLVVIFALIVNTYAIHRFSEVALMRSFASLSHRERIPLFITGAVSFAGWATAIICGLLISG